MQQNPFNEVFTKRAELLNPFSQTCFIFINNSNNNNNNKFMIQITKFNSFFIEKVIPTCTCFFTQFRKAVRKEAVNSSVNAMINRI